LRYSTVRGLLRYFGTSGFCTSARPRNAHHLLAGGVADRQHLPVAKPVDDAPAAGGRAYPGGEQLGVGVAAAAQMVDRRGPAGRGVPELIRRDCPRRHGPLLLAATRRRPTMPDDRMFTDAEALLVTRNAQKS